MNARSIYVVWRWNPTGEFWKRPKVSASQWWRRIGSEARWDFDFSACWLWRQLWITVTFSKHEGTI